MRSIGKVQRMSTMKAATSAEVSLFPGNGVRPDLNSDQAYETEHFKLYLSEESEADSTRRSKRNQKAKVSCSRMPDGVTPERILDAVRKLRSDRTTTVKAASSSSKETVTKTEKAFPLEDRSQFYQSLMSESGDPDPNEPGANVRSYVAFNPREKETESAKISHRDLLLNDKVMKELEAKLPGDQIEEIKPKIGKKKMKKLKKEEREKTKGDGWFGMMAPEMTEEKKRDLEVLQMRGAIDPKRFYKKNDHKSLPKYFQIGQVVDSAADFYSHRTTKKAAKRSLVDDLMADAEYQKYSKRKYAEIIDEKAKQMPRHKRAKLAKKKRSK